MREKPSPVHLIFTIVHSVLAIVTLLPTGTASKVSHLGYNSLCSFQPWSAIILVALATMHLFLHRKSLKTA